MMNIPIVPLVLSLGSMISIGVAWFLAGRIAKKLSPLASIFLFQGIGVPFFFLLLPFNTTPIASVSFRGLAAVGFFETIVMLFLFRAMGEGDLSVVVPITDTYALVTFGLGIFFLHESLSVFKIAGVMCVVLGVIFLSTNIAKTKLRSVFSMHKGTHLAIIASIGTGIYFYGVTLLSRGSGWFYTALGIRVGLTFTSFIFLLFKHQVNKKLFFKLPWGWLAAGALLDVIGFSLYNIAVGMYETSYVTMITSTSSLVIVLLGVFILKEKLAKHQIFGVLCLVGGLILLQIR